MILGGILRRLLRTLGSRTHGSMPTSTPAMSEREREHGMVLLAANRHQKGSRTRAEWGWGMMGGFGRMNSHVRSNLGRPHHLHRIALMLGHP